MRCRGQWKALFLDTVLELVYDKWLPIVQDSAMNYDTLRSSSYSDAGGDHTNLIDVHGERAVSLSGHLTARWPPTVERWDGFISLHSFERASSVGLPFNYIQLSQDRWVGALRHITTSSDTRPESNEIARSEADRPHLASAKLLFVARFKTFHLDGFSHPGTRVAHSDCYLRPIDEKVMTRAPCDRGFWYRNSEQTPASGFEDGLWCTVDIERVTRSQSWISVSKPFFHSVSWGISILMVALLCFSLI